MSNAANKQATREEEMAFLALEEVLGVDIELADAGAGDKKPDGKWIYPESEGRYGIVEITSPPADDLMKEWAAAKREGRPQSESGSVDTRFGELHQVCAELLAQAWGKDNLNKLLAHEADERHLFLFARGHDVGDYFCRLSDSYHDGGEYVEDLVLPDGISDVWFRGRASRDCQDLNGVTQVWLARFQQGSGWHRYVVSMEERQLPAPSRGITDDRVSEGWRQPKNRTGSGHR